MIIHAIHLAGDKTERFYSYSSNRLLVQSVTTRKLLQVTKPVPHAYHAYHRTLPPQPTNPNLKSSNPSPTLPTTPSKVPTLLTPTSSTISFPPPPPFLAKPPTPTGCAWIHTCAQFGLREILTSAWGNGSPRLGEGGEGRMEPAIIASASPNPRIKPRHKHARRQKGSPATSEKSPTPPHSPPKAHSPPSSTPPQPSPPV
ncbi:hypothetical protein B9479_008222 [Cryptococcus floricola]|uniref:Uncharacterized protein n=1 Tax=Cryptococcus floricola TaxID=2591691 RepID=A0A5D3ALF6_9TREE|nr:hypothetical protein B9479_008222 [Cryptococcus floricola]